MQRAEEELKQIRKEKGGEVVEDVLNGNYQHYKGNMYRVIGVAKHSETLDEYVVYQALYGEKQIWIRPKKMFLEMVESDGVVTPRFKYLSD